ncbi:DUF5712 family protein [Pedobacter sp. SYP-B3415]|uniref:DUF5712 family protein n=1 Tax=Pedobacter sp. SYP-B3415 TaxID=2496641 RepID=UPI00101DC3C0|nr:DUF5712 family protein [Pedobacter sp. SYP-B3415]
MFINISDSSTSDNKGSCGPLVAYLEKENRAAGAEKREYWFNETERSIEPYVVCKAIDNNIAKLSSIDAKFFLINISPSQKEIDHIRGLVGIEKQVEALKRYAVAVMDEYARNFKRPGVGSATDLLWFGKMERNRYYSFKDHEVKQGSKKRGDLKRGDQMHIQIIVSRKDITNKIKLSPMNTSRGKNATHSAKLGQFNRMAFKHSGETLFDEMFGFNRGLSDSLAYANVKANGELEHKSQLQVLQRGQHRIVQAQVLQLGREISDAVGGTPAKMPFEQTLDMLLKADYSDQHAAPTVSRKKRRRKGRSFGRGL